MNLPVSKWVNTEPDAGAVPALLERLAQRVPVDAVEELWIFPTRRLATAESTVLLVAALADEPEQRRVITARYAVSRDRKGVATVQEQLEEHGIAPAAAVTRIVNGVLHRLDEEGEQPPRTQRIERDPERWWTLLEELGGRRPEAAPTPSPPDPSPDPGGDASGAPGDSQSVEQ